MTSEDIRDSVLSVLCAADTPLTAEEIAQKMRPVLELRDVRIALRELADEREVMKDASGRWSAIAKLAEVRNPPAHDFTEAELQRARQLHGTTTTCPNCGKRGDIDRLFSWRRMHPEDANLQPQSWCIQCRAESAHKS